MANEKRLVDANDLKWHKFNYVNDYDAYRAGWNDAIDAVMENAPTVDAVEVVHGRWIEHKHAEEEDGLLVSNYECTVCHSWERDEGYYCPNCGAKMDGKREDGDGNA